MHTKLTFKVLQHLSTLRWTLFADQIGFFLIWIVFYILTLYNYWFGIGLALSLVYGAIVIYRQHAKLEKLYETFGLQPPSLLPAPV